MHRDESLISIKAAVLEAAALSSMDAYMDASITSDISL